MASSAGDIAAWIRNVHSLLAPGSEERASTQLGTVTIRHRTTRPEWFGDYDQAWAMPHTPSASSWAAASASASSASASASASSASASAMVDVITASLDDLPADLAPPRIDRSMLGVRGEVRHLDRSPTRMIWVELGGEVAAWDPESSAAIVIRSSPPTWFDRITPLRWLVHWSVVNSGGMLLHAACVGQRTVGRNAGVLLLGEAGYGKSTTTLGCLNSGWVTCGDDAVAVFPDDSGWYAQAVYSAMKTKLARDGTGATDSTGLESPAAVTWDVDAGKRVHLLSSTKHPTLASRIEIDGLILLAPDDPPDMPYSRVEGSLARTRIAPSTVMPLPFDRHVVLERIGRLVSEVPCFSLPRRRTVAESVGDVSRIAAEVGV